MNKRRRIFLFATVLVGIATVAIAYPLIAGGGSPLDAASGAVAGYVNDHAHRSALPRWIDFCRLQRTDFLATGRAVRGRKVSATHL